MHSGSMIHHWRPTSDVPIITPAAIIGISSGQGKPSPVAKIHKKKKPYQ
jgi:hypothetical protein